MGAVCKIHARELRAAEQMLCCGVRQPFAAGEAHGLQLRALGQVPRGLIRQVPALGEAHALERPDL